MTELANDRFTNRFKIAFSNTEPNQGRSHDSMTHAQQCNQSETWTHSSTSFPFPSAFRPLSVTQKL